MTLLRNWLTHHKAYEAQGRKLAIYVGPGGNAGVISSGITCAMWQLKAMLPNALYIGASVGAYNWLYTLHGQGFPAATVFGRFYCDNNFFSPWRLLTKRPSLGLNFVIHDVLEHRVPMPYNSAQQSRYQLKALSTDAQGNLALWPLSQIEKPLAQKTLFATAAMPLIGRTDDLTNLEGWDGWLVEPHLLEHLKNQGITDVIWILNRPLVEQLSKPVALLWKRIIRKLKAVNPSLSTLVEQRMSAGDFLANPPSGLNLEVFHPHINISGNARNPAILFNALGTAYRTMGTYLGHPNLPYPAEWAPYTHHMPANEAPTTQNPNSRL